MRQQARLLRSTQPSAHPDYTSEYDSVIGVSSGTILAPYATLIAVHGNNVTVQCPATTTQLPPVVKDAKHFAVVNFTGASGLLIDGNGNDINNGATLALPATAGACAHLYWSTDLQQWMALVSGAGGAVTFPPSYTARGPTVRQVFDNSAFVAVGQAQVTTAPFTSGQKAVIMVTRELQSSTVGALAQANYHIFDGVASNGIDEWHQMLAPPDETTAGPDTSTCVTEIVGNGSARTFGLAVVANDAQNVAIPAQGCRIVVMILDA